METLELLEDIQQARAQVDSGETVPHDQALEYLISRWGKRESNRRSARNVRERPEDQETL